MRSGDMRTLRARVGARRLVEHLLLERELLGVRRAQVLRVVLAADALAVRVEDEDARQRRDVGLHHDAAATLRVDAPA